MWETIFLFVVFVLAWIYRTWRRPQNMPPGPSPWPFIGNLDILFSTSRFHVRSQELGKQFGGMYSFQYALYPGLIITDFKLAKEAFIDKGDVYSDRASHTDYSKMVSATKDKGVAFQSGDTSKRLRRMSIMSFRLSGVGKCEMEQKIGGEAAEVIAAITRQDGRYFSLDNLFNKATLNVLCAVLFDTRYSYDDPLYLKVLESMNTFFKQAGFRNVSQFLPWWTFCFIPYVKPGFKQLQEIRSMLRKWVVDHIREHRETFDEENLRDFVDLYLNAQATEEQGLYSEAQLLNTVVDLLAAGTETTSTTLLWAVIFLVKHPHVQHKCRQEIRQHVGERQLTYRERGSLPYLEATLCEILRCANTTPHVIPYRTTRTSTLAGYTIAADTIVNLNIYAIHMDASLWPQPTAFTPERFLDHSGKVVTPQAFLPFGLGKRSCLGEKLAKMELWIFVAEILQKFELVAEDVASLPTPENTDCSLTLIPERFHVKAVRTA